MDPLALAEQRSLALHRAVLELLERDPASLARARTRVEQWLATGSVHPRDAQAWAKLLDGPFNELRAVLVDESEHARALRHVTPFAGFVDARTRWRIWREVRARMSALP